MALKIIEYPKGNPTEFIDGRILRQVQEFSLRGRLPMPGTPPVPRIMATGAIPLFVTPSGRAAYIKQILVTLGEFVPTLNYVVLYQLWADGVIICDAVENHGINEIKIYVPPLTAVAAYFLVLNYTALPVLISVSLQWIIFDATEDIWEWGVGKQGINPANGNWF